MASKIKVNLDTNKENYLVAKCKQNDDIKLEATIYENGLEKDLTSSEIMIQALKADNTYIIQDTDISKENNIIIANLNRDFTRIAGTTKIEIVLRESGKQNTTFSFYLEVVGSVINKKIESENTVTILETLTNKVVEAVQVKEETEQLIQSGGAATKGDIQEVNSQLAQKANQNEVRKTTVDLTLNDFNEATRNVLQGQSQGQINAVLGSRNVKTKNIDRDSIIPELIYGYKKSKNLYRRDYVIEGKTISSINSFVTSNSDTTGVCVVPVVGGITYTKGILGTPLTTAIMLLDYEKNFISYVTNTSTFTTPSNCCYVAFNIDNQYLNIYMLCEGNSLPTTYYPYEMEYETPLEYTKEYNSKYRGTFSKLNEWRNANFVSKDNKLFANGKNSILAYSVGYGVDKFYSVFKVTPKIYSDTNSGISVIGISNSANTSSATLDNTIGIAFNPTSTGNLVQGFNKGTRETLKWIDWTNASDFTNQEYTVTIMKDGGHISVHIISSNEYSTAYGKIEYCYKIYDETFKDLSVYIFSNDNRGIENNMSINSMDYTCSFNFERQLKTVFCGETTNSNFRIYLPQNYSYKNKYKAIICFHGNGTDEAQWSLNDNMLYIQKKLTENNFIVLTCSYKNSKTTWGNKYSTQAYYEAYKYLINNYNISSCAIYCNSMGGIESLNALSERKIKAECWVGTVPTYDLSASYGNTTGQDFSGVINSAYEITNTQDYDKKTKGRNPALMPNYTFGCIPMLIIGATGDTTINPIYHCNKLYDDLYPVSNVTKIMKDGGNHSQFDLLTHLDTIVNFYNINMY